MDVVELLESDSRVHTLFTVAPNSHGEEWNGTEEFIKSSGGVVLPWRQATQHTFAMILTASFIGIDQLRGRILYLPHGPTAVMSRRYARTEAENVVATHGLEREYLMRLGRLIPSALMLTHDSELEVLSAACPEALGVARVAGDICLDRLRASVSIRSFYRAFFEVEDGRTLVFVTSTWRPESAYGKHPDLFEKISSDLPAEKYQIVAALHPNTWSIYGEKQVRSWLAGCVRRGMIVVPPEEGWRAALVAADCVIGDHGGVTQYAAAVDKPVLLASSPIEDTRENSPAEYLAKVAPTLTLNGDSVVEQIEHSRSNFRSGQFRNVSEAISSQPGLAGKILRTEMYRLLNIPEPECNVETRPVPPTPESLRRRVFKQEILSSRW